MNDKSKMWKVYPTKSCPWFVPTYCLTRASAEAEREKYERVTGYEWKIKEPIEGQGQQ